MNWFKSFWKALTTPMPREGSKHPKPVPIPVRRAGHEFLEPMNNFTPRAQQVLGLARKEADRFNHNFVGTEHLLLGLIALGQGTAVNVLRKLGLDIETVRTQVENCVGTGPDQKVIGNIPYTPRVKKVLALAAKEARALNHTYVGTEHILLGLLREGDGVAARVFQNLGVGLEKTREEILRELDPNYPTTPGDATMAQCPELTKPPESIDASKRYDVYCAEGSQNVVYRNALLKGMKKVFPLERHDRLAEFLELEQANGQTILVARSSVIKFCEPGVTPGSEPA
jgi:ATP-dependent Clp protease ATP-binding subunit ClpA